VEKCPQSTIINTARAGAKAGDKASEPVAAASAAE